MFQGSDLTVLVASDRVCPKHATHVYTHLQHSLLRGWSLIKDSENTTFLNE